MEKLRAKYEIKMRNISKNPYLVRYEVTNVAEFASIFPG